MSEYVVLFLSSLSREYKKTQSLFDILWSKLNFLSSLKWFNISRRNINVYNFINPIEISKSFLESELNIIFVVIKNWFN